MLYKFTMVGYCSDMGEYKQEGIINGTTMTDAVSRVESWYEDELSVLTIECITESENEPCLISTKYGPEDRNLNVN